MAISFPGSPSIGDIHTHNTLRWYWDGVGWNQVGGDHTTEFIGTLSNRPADTTSIGGQIYYNELNKTMEMYNGEEWVAVSQDNRQYLHRTIITRSWVMGGYKSGAPWYNVNSMNHQTDLMANLGDLLHTKASYSSGGCGKVYGFIWNANNAHSTASTTTAGINMATETGLVAGDCPTLLYSRNDCGTAFKETEYAYLCGGGTTNIDVFNLTSNTMYAAQSMTTASAGGTGNGMSSINGETAGYVWPNGAGDKLLFAANQVATVSASVIGASNGQQKGINSKVGKGYAGNEGTYQGGYNLRRWQFSTETNIGNVARPIGNIGEENFDMGQDHQYMLGMYGNSVQNNRGWKFSYYTDSGYELGAGSVRTGVPGGSSGHCVWSGS